jgi:hypothetical protein
MSYDPFGCGLNVGGLPGCFGSELSITPLRGVRSAVHSEIGFVPLESAMLSYLSIVEGWAVKQ